MTNEIHIKMSRLKYFPYSWKYWPYRPPYSREGKCRDLDAKLREIQARMERDGYSRADFERYYADWFNELSRARG